MSGYCVLWFTFMYDIFIAFISTDRVIRASRRIASQDFTARSPRKEDALCVAHIMILFKNVPLQEFSC